MNKYLNMTAGPTHIKDDVLVSMAIPFENSDLDSNFYEIYKKTTVKLQQLFQTKNDCIILAGEAILGLEASIASLIEQDDKVLCIANGIFGRGFGDFAKMYGAKVTNYNSNDAYGIDVKDLAKFLEENNDFKLATVVHCDTPTAVTNNVQEICKLLTKYDILSVVDSVSAVGGEVLNVDEASIDICIGGPQKALSAPVGTTIMSISDKAYSVMNNRKTPIKGFYTNLTYFKTWYEKKWFPYTMPSSLIFALDKALDNVLNDESITKHSIIANAVRDAIMQSGLQLFAKDHNSNTVTAIYVPEQIEYKQLFDEMLKSGVMISGSLSEYEGKLFRIGHMGQNCTYERVNTALKTLDEVLRKNGVLLSEEPINKIFTRKYYNSINS